jgi:hypothetical protein
MVAIVAPAIAAAFPNLYLNFNGWLKSIGIKAVFDVSFGAELTIKSYLEHVQKNHPKAVIAQPCPAIVNYIELYRPELLEYLAPADSPMLHTIKMVKEFYPEYRGSKFAVISPCIAKGREFEATACGDYNITMLKLEEYFDDNRIDLCRFPATEYDNHPLAERAAMFSTPGGLLETAARWNPDLRKKIRKIEGPHAAYHYLDQLAHDIALGRAPLVIDILNCHLGCNGGTGTKACYEHTSMDTLESIIEARIQELKQRFLEGRKSNDSQEDDAIIQEKMIDDIERHWKPGLYDRRYSNRSNTGLNLHPSQAELDEAYRAMLKYTPEDHKNCSACGYGNCKDMAVAIVNELNRPENCHFYMYAMLETSMDARKATLTKFEGESEELLAGFAPILKSIEDVSMLTTILALNATIEAANAGEAGRGFGVVAGQVGELAKKTKEETITMQKYVKKLKKMMTNTIAEFKKESGEAED